MVVPPAPQTFTTVDFFIIGVVLVSGVIGLFRGITREFFGLTSWIVSIWGCNISSPYIKPFLSGYIHNTSILEFLTPVLGFLIILILCTLISRSISKVIKKSPLSGLDRTLGLPFGFLRGIFLIVCLFLAYTIFMAKDDIHPVLKDSKFIPFISESANYLRSLINLPDYSINNVIEEATKLSHSEELKLLSNPLPKSEDKPKTDKQELDTLFKKE